jgi:hypothetical protein
MGVPSAGVMTVPFSDAADLMARVLGAEDFPFVVNDHPISSASEEALRERAKAAVAQSVAILTKAA